MKKTWILIAALAVSAFSARAEEEATPFQQQIDELSARIAQLEKDNTAKAWSIEQLQAEGKKDEAASWANDIKIKGDIRARYENRESFKLDGKNNDKDRFRVRVRAGVYGKINDPVDFGIRLATGGSRTSSNQDLDGSGSMKDIFLDQAYVDYHPDQVPGVHAWIGKIPQPWMAADSGLIWDTDLNPEGAALTFEKQFSPVKLKANAGAFLMEEELGDDIRLWSGQLAAEKKIGAATLILGVSDYYFQNASTASTNLTSALAAGSANTPGTEFHLLEGFGSCSFTVATLPVKLNGQYVVNDDAANSDEDTAYLAGITVGKAKDPRSWELGYSYRDIENDAVVGGLNDSDFAGETWTGCYGHRFSGKYQLGKNVSADLAYILSTDANGQDANTLQADLNFKF